LLTDCHDMRRKWCLVFNMAIGKAPMDIPMKVFNYAIDYFIQPYLEEEGRMLAENEIKMKLFEQAKKRDEEMKRQQEKELRRKQKEEEEKRLHEAESRRQQDELRITNMIEEKIREEEKLRNEELMRLIEEQQLRNEINSFKNNRPLYNYDDEDLIGQIENMVLDDNISGKEPQRIYSGNRFDGTMNNAMKTYLQPKSKKNTIYAENPGAIKPDLNKISSGLNVSFLKKMLISNMRPRNQDRSSEDDIYRLENIKRKSHETEMTLKIKIQNKNSLVGKKEDVSQYGRSKSSNISVSKNDLLNANSIKPQAKDNKTFLVDNNIMGDW
jgi:hypothetical protein